MTSPTLPLIIGTQVSIYYLVAANSLGFNTIPPSVTVSNSGPTDLAVQPTPYNPFVFEVSFTVSSVFINSTLTVALSSGSGSLSTSSMFFHFNVIYYYFFIIYF